MLLIRYLSIYTELKIEFFRIFNKKLYICSKQGVRALHQSLIESVNLDKVTTFNCCNLFLYPIITQHFFYFRESKHSHLILQ